MPAGNLPIADTEEVFEQKNGKDPLKIRVSLFFDGTLNNRDNIAEREKNSKIYQDNRTDDANSYDNGRTNIAIMEPHVSDKIKHYAGEYDYVFKHYIAGQGPITHQKDSPWGYALAIGESGVPRRAEEGIKKAAGSILGIQGELHKYYIEKLTIDVFGFSRGAATARYAIHVIFNGKILRIDDQTGEVIYEWRPIVDRINPFIEIDETAVEVRFAGLYDTVVSYMGSQKLSWTSNVLQQKAVTRAKKVLHLAAADEHRKDFSLYTIQSAVGKGVGEEYYLPGAHSDVGGSYNTASELAIQNATDEKNKVYMLPTSEGHKGEVKLNWLGKPKGGGMVINKGYPPDMERDRLDLIAQGWYTPDQITVQPVLWDQWGNCTESILAVWREHISSAYCNIPLKIMAEYARCPEVKLVINTELEDRTQIILEPEPDLQELEYIIREYMASTQNSKPGDWIDDHSPLNSPFLKGIRNRHFNFSASKMSVGYGPRIEWDSAARKYRRRRYYYDA